MFNIYHSCRSLTSVVLPQSVDTIGRKAFWGCTSLEQRNIPNGVKAIEESTFRECSSLIGISLPQSIASIGETAFKNCLALVAINFPKGLEKINESAFEGCSSLRELTIPASCKEIRNYAFQGCKIQKLVLEDSKESLKLGYNYVHTNSSWDFFDYRNLFSDAEIDTLYWGRPIEQPNEWCGYYNTGKRYNEGYGVFGNGINKIVVGDFITDEDINNGVTKSLFHNSNNGLSREYYHSLTSWYHHVTFGKGISTIPDLTYNTALDTIIVLSANPPAAEGFSNKTYMNCTLCVPVGCKTSYQSAEIWKNFWNIEEISSATDNIVISTSNEPSDDRFYNLNGLRVKQPAKGVYIRNGKKIVIH